MKNKKSIFIVQFLVVLNLLVLSSGCSSLPKTSGSFVLPDKKTEYRVIVENVEINVEKVLEGDLSNQFKSICESLLKKSDCENELYLSVKINQRSFSKGIDEKKSLFMFYTLTDQNDNCVFEKGYYKNTGDSVVSSAVQYSLCKNLCANINAYLSEAKKVK